MFKECCSFIDLFFCFFLIRISLLKENHNMRIKESFLLKIGFHICRFYYIIYGKIWQIKKKKTYINISFASLKFCALIILAPGAMCSNSSVVATPLHWFPTWGVCPTGRGGGVNFKVVTYFFFSLKNNVVH